MNSEHLQRIALGLQMYFKEKQFMDVISVVGTEAFKRTLAQATRNAMQSQPSASIEVLSRFVMQDARNALLQMINTAPPQESQSQPTDPDQDFMSRLSILETQRRIETVQQSLTSSNSPTPTPISTIPMMLSPPAPIIVPLPIKRGRIFPISSQSRDWAHLHERAIFSWPGPLPPRSQQDDALHVAIAAVQTPAFVVDITSFVTLHISGVGDGTTHCVLLPQPIYPNAKWINWMPCSPETRYIRSIPTPWTFQLLDSSGERLHMGADGMKGRLNKERTGVTPIFEIDVSLNDIIRVGTIGRARVGQEPPHKIFASYGSNNADTVPILNESRQWTIFLELEGTN